MNNTFSGIVDSILKKLGLQRVTKTTDLDNDFYNVFDLSLTNVMVDKLATLTLADSDIIIDGDSARAKQISKIITRLFKTENKKIATTCMGTGDTITIPVTDGKHFGVQIVPNRDFVITRSIGEYLYGVIAKVDEKIVNNSTYTRLQYMTMENVNGFDVCLIRQFAYKDGNEISLTKVSGWENINPEQYITNVDRLLIGRFKNPTVNRADLNSDQGVPITYGNDVAIENAKKSYEIFNKELKKKQTKLFVSKQLLKKDTEGNTTLTEDGFYQLLKSDLDGNLPIKEFAPDLRYEQLKGFVDYNFKMLEMFCGFSTGLLSDVDMNMVTATAIRSSLISTYAFITSMRDIIEQGMTDYTYAIEMLLNANESYVPTNYTIKFDWDDSIMESSTERFNQLLQAKGLKAITTAELRAWTMGESEEVAEQKIAEMEATAATDTNNQLEL